MLIAWTTVASRAEATALARGVVGLGLAVCVQIDGPVASVYRWAGKLEQADEFRLTFKLTSDQLAALEAHVLAHHPYETPEWLVVRAEAVGEKYLSWARTNANSSPL